MRVFSCGMLLALLAFRPALGEETSFASGPQYLINQSSVYATSFFLRPISTPSLSLSDPPLEVGASNATGVLISGAENQTVLPPQAVALPQVDLFPIFYGQSPVSEIEISSSTENGPAVAEIPASLSDEGVTQITTVQSLRERGYGITLAEAAAQAKSRGARPPHIYTNDDIERLHPGS